MNALILAAGFAKRLYPLTENFPKDLLKVRNKPIIEYVIEKLLETKEVEKVYILSNNVFYINFLEWLEGYKEKDRIKLISNRVNKEQDKKGAVYDFQKALETIEYHELFVLACDNLFNFDLNKIIRLNKEKNKSVIALKYLDEKSIRNYSCVLIDNEGKIIFFEEKPNLPKSNLCSTACYLLTKQDIIKIKNNNFDEIDNLGNLIEFLYKESEIYGVIYEDYWADIGSKEDLEKAEKFSI